MEKKNKGELKIEGSKDILTMALETPEHSGRVRAVGGNVNPSTYFNIPRKARDTISKNELLAILKKENQDLLERIQKLEEKGARKEPVTPNIVQGQGMVSDKASCFYEDKAKYVDLQPDTEDKQNLKVQVEVGLDMEDTNNADTLKVMNH